MRVERLTRDRCDLTKKGGQKAYAMNVVMENLGAEIWASVPCTAFCPLQRINVKTLGPTFQHGLYRKKQETLKMVRIFDDVAQLVFKNGGDVHF